MRLQKIGISIASAVLVLSFAAVSAASALTTSCVGAPTASNITWTASSAGGIAPTVFLWGNGSTSPMQIITVAPGTYSMTLQATDASSTVATSTCTATVAASSGGTDVSAQIQALLAQIKALQAQILVLIANNTGGGSGTGTSTPPVIGCSFNRDLSEGQSGDDVKSLQTTLSSDPSILPPGLITGFFGARTREALRKFQQKFGIASSTIGFFGPKTRGFMRDHCGGNNLGNSTSTSAQSEDNGENGNNRGDSMRGVMSTSTSSSSMHENGSGGDNGNRGNGGNGNSHGGN